jgi:hypothetical protein
VGGVVYTLRDLIGDRPVRREDWELLAWAWELRSDYTLQEIAPEGVTCAACWDHGRCAECLGEYPQLCPMDCEDGRCAVCGKKGEQTPTRT